MLSPDYNKLNRLEEFKALLINNDELAAMSETQLLSLNDEIQRLIFSIDEHINTYLDEFESIYGNLKALNESKRRAIAVQMREYNNQALNSLLKTKNNKDKRTASKMAINTFISNAIMLELGNHIEHNPSEKKVLRYINDTDAIIKDIDDIFKKIKLGGGIIEHINLHKLEKQNQKDLIEKFQIRLEQINTKNEFESFFKEHINYQDTLREAINTIHARYSFHPNTVDYIKNLAEKTFIENPIEETKEEKASRKLFWESIFNNESKPDFLFQDNSIFKRKIAFTKIPDPNPYSGSISEPPIIIDTLNGLIDTYGQKPLTEEQKKIKVLKEILNEIPISKINEGKVHKNGKVYYVAALIIYKDGDWRPKNKHEAAEEIKRIFDLKVSPTFVENYLRSHRSQHPDLKDKAETLTNAITHIMESYKPT